MAVTRGKDFYLYRNADSPYDNTPTWDQVVNVRDLTRNNTPALADASIRGSTFRMQVPTLLDMSIDFQMVYDPTDADQLIDVSLVPGYAPTNLPRRVNVAVSGSVVDT
jgi:hypothetical protein